MGVIHRGIPQALAIRLQDEFGLRYFVETGTHVGVTVAWAGGEFDEVISLEAAPGYVDKARERCHGMLNVRIIRADSREGLSHALAMVPGPALIWLDAHWSPDLDYPRPEAGECPVLEELAQIVQDGRPHVVLIDDARYFCGTPPRPHQPADWPTFARLERALPGYLVHVEEDVIVALPKINFALEK